MTGRGETDFHTPCGGLARRLGRCFCFTEVSTGHPHRNDKKLVILSDVAFAAVQDKASNGGRRGQKLFALQANNNFWAPQE